MARLWYLLKTVMGIVFRHPILGATIIPILPDGRLVLVRRRDNGQWGLPGGIMAWGEDILTTARRELKEETGLTIVSVIRLVGVYSAFDRDPRTHSVSIVIEAAVAGVLGVQDTQELYEVKAFTKEEIPFGNLAHDHDRQLEDYFKGETIIA